MVRLSVVAVLGTAGVYSGLYGFAAADRTFVVLGIVLAVLAAAGLAVTVVQRSWWWSRRRPMWVAGTADVLTVSPRPKSGEYGRGELRLALTAPGLPVAEVQVRDAGGCGTVAG